MDPDPWNWSVDDVLLFFRERAANYIADMPHSRLPTLDSFVTTLRENDIDGATLLAYVDAGFLQNDCGIREFGARVTVLRCVEKLRKQSTKYANDQAPQTPQTPAFGSGQPPAPVSASPHVPPSTSGNPAKRARSAEVLIEDAQGKKRRKLDISKLKQDDQPKPELTTDGGYFGKSAYPVDYLFYGSTKLGQEVEDMHPAGEVIVYDGGDENFDFFFQGKAIGETRYIYNQMRHFMSNNEAIDVKRSERTAMAFVPYRDGLNEGSRSATVLQFKAGKDEPVAIRENLNRLESGTDPDDHVQQDEPAGEWEFLVRKHKSSGDELLPVYGESDEDDSEDSVETTEFDTGHDAAEEVDDRNISKDRVLDIVEAAVKGYVATWQGSVEKLEKKRAWTIWKKTKGSRTIRDSLILGAQSRIEHLTARLNKIKREIVDTDYQSEKAIQEACVALEVTVIDREEQRWMIDIWKRRQEPSHVVHHGTKTVHTGLPTPLTTGKAAPPLQIHPHDRLIISPAPDGGVDTDIQTPEEILYEADDEEYHTPPHNPEPSDDAYAAFLDSADELPASPEDVAHDTNGDTGLEPHTDTDTVPNEPLPNGDDNDSSFSPDAGSPESDDLVSPSTFVNLIKSTQAQRSEQKSSSTHVGMSSSPSTPTKKKQQAAPAAAYKGVPLVADAAVVDSWDMVELARRNDRMRILIKLLRSAGARNRDRLHAYQTSMARQDFLHMLYDATRFAKESGRVGVDLDEAHIEPIFLAGSICVSWVFPTMSSEAIRTMDGLGFDHVLSQNQIRFFSEMLTACLQRRTSKLFLDLKRTPSKSTPSKQMSSKPRSSTPIVISSDDQEQSQQRNQRKRAVVRSQVAERSRVKAFERERKFAESQTAHSSQLAAMIPSDSSSSAVEINPVRDEGTDPIYVCDRIARKMKAHQIDGVQFLWREITADDDDGAQGCLLAHTMGLGKTMQTIALLVALNEAARSKKKAVFRQVPSHLRPGGIRERSMRALILCPPALIENWSREVNEWAPKMLGHVFCLDSGTKTARMNQLEDWMRLGGVVLLGYQKFRTMVLQKPNANQKNAMSDEQQIKLKQILVEGTEIVVADEAHNLKNTKSDIGKAVAEIQTHSRIGLTGTPMSNDVEEIYALISWVAPGYLGNPVEFRAHYTEPIKNGLYTDSSPSEKKKSTMRLTVLHSEIQPKVNRANIEALRGSLKPKVEFVITLPLGEVQTELYRRYIKAVMSGGENSTATQVRLFGWLGILTLLTNHPRCFRMKLLAPRKSGSSKKTGLDTEAEDDTSRNRTPIEVESGSATPISEDAVTIAEELADTEATKEAPADAPLHKLGLTESMIQSILQGFVENADPQLSAKVSIFLTLLKYSLECKDKVLVFSSSIPTLEYLDELLTQQGLSFGRIDGQTKMQKRMQALEDFHHDDFDIMLVSTRAGGVGLNIQGANRVFIFDFGFNPTWEEQAIGRAYRLGQTKPVYVYRFVAGGTFETNIYNKQLFKSSLAQRVVDKKNPQRNVRRNTRDYLYEPETVYQENLDEETGKDPNVLDRLLSQHGPGEEGKIDTMIRAIKTMETLQVETLDEPLNEEEQREVQMEIQQGRLRPKGKRAPGATQMPPPNSAVVRLPISTQNPRVQNGPALAPPPSTFAGPSNYQRPQIHPLGGLPMPRTQQPYQQ